MIVSLIVCVNNKNAIGLNGNLLYKIKKDMKFFVENTKNKTVIMGRKTCESIGKPLKDRQNIVVTRNKDFKKDGFIVYNDLETALESCKRNCVSECVIIGGSEIYNLAKRYVKIVYLTRVYDNTDGDTLFSFDYTNFLLKSYNHFNTTVENKYAFSFSIYEKISIFAK